MFFIMRIVRDLANKVAIYYVSCSLLDGKAVFSLYYGDSGCMGTLICSLC